MYVTNICEPVKPGYEKLELGEHIYVYTTSPLLITRDKNMSIVVLGRISNLDRLARTFGIADPKNLILELINSVGATKMTQLLEGNFAILHYQDNCLALFNDACGQLPLYYSVSNNQFIITTKVSLLTDFGHFSPILKPFDDFFSSSKPFNYSPYTNLKRLDADSFLRIECNERIDSSIQANIQNILAQPSEINDGSQFLTLLEQSVSDDVGAHDKIGIPLSGGVDSSTISALINQSGKELFTYSIGTEFSDEFEYSNTVAKHLGSTHKTTFIESEDIIDLMTDLIQHNEVFDPLSIEILLPFGTMYSIAKKDGVKAMATGYGADLILGGTLAHLAPNQLMDSSIHLIQRTFWTNEFSTNYANHFDIDIRHPFWKPSLIKYGLNTSYKHKIVPPHVKHSFRKLVDETNYLPKEIVWREKLGIHEGSSMKKLIQKATNCKSDREISSFIYSLFEKSICRSNSLNLNK